MEDVKQSRCRAVRLSEIAEGSKPSKGKAVSVTVPLDAAAVVTARTPEETGEWVRITVRMNKTGSPFDREKDIPVKTSHTVRVLTVFYAELGVRVGDILSCEQADALLEAGQVSQAVVCGEASLAYGDRSARRLTQKLMAKGFAENVAAQAVAYLKKKGWIREESAALRQAEQDLRKRWGLARIRSDLFSKGFTREAVEEALEALLQEDVDFVANCQAVILKKYGGVPNEPKARQSMKAALVRLGYSSEEIREAMERCRSLADDSD